MAAPKTKATYMDPVSMETEYAKLSEVERYYVRKMQAYTVQRAKEQKYIRQGARRIGLTCGAIAISICIL